MNCPKCTGEGNRKAAHRQGNNQIRRIECMNCGAIYFVKLEETLCDSEEFYQLQRKYENDRYRKRCMEAFKGA